MFGAVFRLELRQLVRQPLTWIVLAIMAAAMLIGSAAGVTRVRAQQATVERVIAEEEQSVVRAKEATRRYSRPGDLVIPVFRDPTDAYSYFYNFLIAYAVKPPAPLASISAGQSDLQPSQIRINMNAVFPDTAYELRSPRILALGAFDLGFVLVYLLPLAVIALGGTSLSREQDSGVLRMIAAQPVKPRTVAGAKFGALAILLIPTVVLTVYLSLAVTGAIGSAAGLAGLAVLGAMIALYILFWIALCALVVSFWKGGVQALATLVLSWAVMTVLVPAAGALLINAVWPAPSRVAYIDASRALADRFSSSWEDPASAARWLASRPDLIPGGADAVTSADVGRLARDVYFREELGPRRDAFEAHSRRTVRASEGLRLLSPASMLDGSLQKLADTDMASQLDFTRAADLYAQTLRRRFEPLIVANVGKVRPCATCPGRLNFGAYDAVPEFPVEQDPGPGLRHGLLAIVYLLLVTSLSVWLAIRRFRNWPL